jgi:hypothetical protein
MRPNTNFVSAGFDKCYKTISGIRKKQLSPIKNYCVVLTTPAYTRTSKKDKIIKVKRGLYVAE